MEKELKSNQLVTHWIIKIIEEILYYVKYFLNGQIIVSIALALFSAILMVQNMAFAKETAVLFMEKINWLEPLNEGGWKANKQAILSSFAWLSLIFYLIGSFLRYFLKININFNNLKFKAKIITKSLYLLAILPIIFFAFTMLINHDLDSGIFNTFLFFCVLLSLSIYNGGLFFISFIIDSLMIVPLEILDYSIRGEYYSAYKKDGF